MRRERGSLASKPFVRSGFVVRPWVNPLVCVCEEPRVGTWGECQVCKRKPLSEFRVLREAAQA